MFLSKITDYIAHHRILSKYDKILVTLSGGADSVALLRVLVELGYHVSCAHCNFHLRGEESNRDEAFVNELCRHFNIPLYVKDFDVPVYMEQQGVSLEMACRDLRYAWWNVLCREQEFTKIAVAHHRDDNIETFFLNAIRGTGMAGVAGIQPVNGRIVRPLLCVSRSEIEAFLKVLEQPFVIDSTNLENDARRNQLRNVVLPALYREFPQAGDTLAATISHLRDGYDLQKELVERVARDFVSEENGVLKIDTHELLHFVNSASLLFEIIKGRDFNYKQCEDIVKTCQSENGVGKHFYSSSYTLTVNRDNLEVFLLEATLENAYAIKLNSNLIEKPVGIEICRETNAKFTPACCNGTTVIALDSAVLECKEVKLRRWKIGDRFRPFGMKGSKLVSDFFADRKLSEREKSNVWLLEADGEIVWIVGYRASQSYAVKPDSTNYLLLTLKG